MKRCEKIGCSNTAATRYGDGHRWLCPSCYNEARAKNWRLPTINEIERRKNETARQR